ncbi:unnamed protein product [Leptosia nina]|uniref:Uncharacterized protein n=1 Tax=Leptosia nina TaxID=320188 RepID=A0AAV1JUD0_9NEOP
MPAGDGSSETSQLVPPSSNANYSYMNLINNFAAILFNGIIIYCCFRDGVSLFSFHPILMSIGWLIFMCTAVNAVTPGDFATEWMPIRLRSARHWVLQLVAATFILTGFIIILTNKIINETMPNIKLQSSDNEIFDVDVEIAKCSVTIKTMLEDLGMDDDEEEVVPLPNVNSAILKKVIQWATYHKDDPPLPEDDENKEKRTDDISSWDADFLKVDQGNMIKGKTPEEIRKTFNIKNDFTAAEEEQVRKENEWCEEK